MSTLFITCYRGLAYDQRGNTVQAGLEPRVENFTLTFTTAAAGAVQMSTLSGTTSVGGIAQAFYVRLTASAAFHWKVATVSTASGTTTCARTPADVIEFIGVDRDGLWISALGAV